jgi:hypothetical protein
MPFKDKEKQRNYNRIHMQNKRRKFVEPVAVEPVEPVVVEPVEPTIVEPVEPTIVEPINPFTNFNFWKSKLTCVQNQLLSIYRIYEMKRQWSRNMSQALNDIKKFNYKSSELKRKQVQITLLDGRIVYFKRK